MSLPPTNSHSAELLDSSTSSQHSPAFSSDSIPQGAGVDCEKQPSSPRAFRIYTRRQLVALSQSPLVKPPPDMPDFKTWLGPETENLVSKKDEPPTPSSARERRFRRDAEEGDTPSRPTFRSTLQPSQMGNFKHQSLRASDRDRDKDRDGDKERERDIRDKEGQERLRHLSDKYDRDRLLPLSSSRNKERDTAPHLNAANPRGQRAVTSTVTSQRADTHEATKKKVGETSEDWRRGAEPNRSHREDRAENGRRDRDDRERARSRARDSSRPKRDTSTSRKERDRDDPRDKPRDRDRDETRREKDDSRRERDDADEDPRRWRDDGKRDERMSARRERARGGNERDTAWTAADERDGRYKRGAGRDRKPGGTADEGKEKDDRREREKEPAWMDTYVPDDSTPGILGGQASNGELDGIQAWKKGLKDKESKDKETTAPPSKPLGEQGLVTTPNSGGRGAMDEIQMFRMLMEKEKDKKRLDDTVVSSTDVTVLLSGKEGDSERSTQVRQAQDDYKHSQAHPAIGSSSTTPDPSSSVSLTLKDTIILSSNKHHPIEERVVLTGKGFMDSLSSEYQGNLSKPSGDFGINVAFPPAGSRVLAMKNKNTSSANSLMNPQNPNGGLQHIVQESPQLFAKNEPSRTPGGFTPFEDPNRHSYGFEDPRESMIPTNMSHRGTIDQPFNAHPQAESNFNGSVGKGSRLAKIFENKARDAPGGSSKLQGGYISHPQTQNPRELNNFGGGTGNSGAPHTVEELIAMLNVNPSQHRNSIGTANASPLLTNNGGFGGHGPVLPSLQQQHLLQQQHHSSNRVENLYDSRADDRNFVPDGMVPGLRPIPPPPQRGRDLGHFNDAVDDPIHYNLQRIAQQQQQSRNLDTLYNGATPAMFNQQGGRHAGGLPPQSLPPHYRGGPSPGLNQTGSISNLPQQRLPPGLANLGGRPPHEPSHFLGLSGPPSGAHNLHGNGPIPQQLPFGNFNVGNNIGFNGSQGRGPGSNSHMQNTGAQQLPLGSLGHPSMDPRLSNHHHLMGLGGSGVGGNRINGGFPPQQGSNAPNHLSIRPQQQHLHPHMLPHLMPPHMQQQGHLASNNPPNPDLMALLMGGPHRE